MSVSRIALSLANAAGVPTNVTSVTLSDISGTYGLLDVTADDVVVPAGVALENLHAGQYEYEISLEQSKIYRYALKVQQGSRAFYLRGYLCPAAQSAEISFSVSDSDSDSEAEEPTDSRSIRVRREDSIRRFVFGQANSHRMRVTIIAAEGITKYLLGHQQRLMDQSGGHIEQFAMIASPRDVGIYPVDSPNPDQSPGYYRKDFIDVILPNSDVADQVWASIKKELDNLVATYNRLEALEL